jgi:MraZ protein
VRAFNRLFYARAERIEVDGQGRIRIPPPLATLSGLEKEAVLLGVHDHLELWDRGRWETYLADKSSQFDQIAENAFGAGQ